MNRRNLNVVVDPFASASTSASAPSSIRSAIMIIILVAACSDVTISPDAALDAPRFDASPGTGALLVMGACIADNSANTTAGNEILVACSLTLSRGGAPVLNAVVNLNPAPPAFQTLLLPTESDGARYAGTYLAYGETARLSIMASADFLAEVVVQGPRGFRITTPSKDEQIAGGVAMNVTWSRPEGAVRRADVAVAAFQALGVEDSGGQEVPADKLPAGPTSLRVTRWRENHLGPGAQAGSRLDFAVRSSIPISIN